MKFQSSNIMNPKTRQSLRICRMVKLSGNRQELKRNHHLYWPSLGVKLNFFIYHKWIHYLYLTFKVILFYIWVPVFVCKFFFLINTEWKTDLLFQSFIFVVVCSYTGISNTFVASSKQTKNNCNWLWHVLYCVEKKLP